VFFIERDTTDADGDTPAQARNVFILSAAGTQEAVTSAVRGRLETEGEQRMLVLERGQRTDIDKASGDKAQASFEDYRVMVGDREARLATRLQPRAMRSIDLLRDPNLPNQGELSWRIGLALGAANLLLLGIGLAATSPRRASNWNLIFALLGFVVYYNLIGLSQAWVASGKLGLGPVLLVLHGGAFGLGLLLLAWRDQGAARRRWWQRRATA
jgi:lipopolysaccharide export system permease protein